MLSPQRVTDLHWNPPFHSTLAVSRPPCSDDDRLRDPTGCDVLPRCRDFSFTASAICRFHSCLLSLSRDFSFSSFSDFSFTASANSRLSSSSVLFPEFTASQLQLAAFVQSSGTTVTFVIVEGSVITVASVGDSRCILESADGGLYYLSAYHRLECSEEERDRVIASGGEVGRLNAGGGAQLC
ncbi:hypothetical protein LXL04_022698 [Taraxacum kok-saghyz]